jgi:hypothetical protein
MLYTHFNWWASLTGSVFISAPRSVCLVLKMVLRFKRFPVCLNCSDNDSALVHCVCRRTISCWLLHYGVSEFYLYFVEAAGDRHGSFLSHTAMPFCTWRLDKFYSQSTFWSLSFIRRWPVYMNILSPKIDHKKEHSDFFGNSLKDYV